MSGDDRLWARQRFEELYDECYPALLGYALRRVPDAADAADVVAETLLVAWRRLGDVPDGPAARLWLFGVARRTLANQRRGEQRRTALSDRLRREIEVLPVPVPEPPDAPASEVREALSRLSPGDREVLTLVAWEGLDGAEIAAVLGCSRTAARVRLHRARGRLRQELVAADDPGPPLPAGHPTQPTQPTHPTHATPARIGIEEAR